MRNNLKTPATALMMAASMLSLGACVSAGPYNGFSDNAMAMVVVHRNPDYGPLTSAQYDVVVEHANACLATANAQLSGPAETVVSMGGAYALGGAAGGAGAAGFIPGGTVGVYGPYMAVANGASGAVAGLGLYSQNKASLVGSCTNGDLQDAATRARTGPGVHAYPSFVRTTNRQTAPSWTVPAGPSQGTTGPAILEGDNTVSPTPILPR